MARNMIRLDLYNSKERHAVTTVIQSRVPVFLPVKQVKDRKGVDIMIETQWGKCTFKNSQLTQIHRNILDCIFTFYYDKHVYEDGCVSFLLSLREIQKKLGISTTNHEWLIEKLDELMDEKIVIETDKFKVHTRIVRKHLYSKVSLNTTKKNLYGNNCYYGIVFESEYMKLFREDINVHSGRLTEAILSLKDGLLQALVRFCISHSNVNMKTDEVLKVIGAVNEFTSKRHIRRLHKKLNKHRDKLSTEFGIKITTDCIFYKKSERVWFENPILVLKADMV